MSNVKRMLRYNSLAVSSALILSACGGGGSSSNSNPPTPSAQAVEVAQIQQETRALNSGNPLVTDAARQQMRALAAGSTPIPIPKPSQVNNTDNGNRVQQYFIHYGEVDDTVINAAHRYPLAILHPLTGKLTRQTIQAIQRGRDADDASDDVKVLLYISVGEDLRTAGLTDEQMAADARFAGDQSGPGVDPRGVFPEGNTEMTDIAVLGAASPAGDGFASYYLDDNSRVNDPNALGDGQPDRNGVFGGAFANIGDPSWFETLQAMTLDGIDGLAGFQEILTDSYGRGLGADGVFLDTLDTAAPNVFTDQRSANQSEFEWTAPGVKRFIERLRANYPEALILQNRGLFFFDPRHPHYQFNARESIDYVLFESYRLDSNSDEDYSPFFFADNKHTIAPKLMAAAAGDDGFQVLSLGYAEGPSFNEDSLFKATGAAYDSLHSDIDESAQAGFRHFIANAAIDFANDFVLNNVDPSDEQAPVWSSIYNANQPGYPAPASAAAPRTGLQALTAEEGGLRLHWDVALDKNPVRYRAYWQGEAFDLSALDPLAAAETKVLTPNPGAGLGEGSLSQSYAFQDVIDGLTPGQQYHVLIRAEDSFGNAESNTTVLNASTQADFAIDGDFGEWQNVAALHSDPADVEGSAGADFLAIKAMQEQYQLYLFFNSNTPFSLDGAPTFTYSRNLIFIDVDNDTSTGYPIAGSIGSDYVINGQHLYSQSATQFNTGFISTLNMALNADSTALELQLPLGLISASNEPLRMVLVNDEQGDYAPDFGGAITFNLDYEDLPLRDIVIDGDISEWAAREGLLDGNDSPDSAGPDWQSLWLASDEDQLYVAWRSEHAYNLDGSPDYPFSRNLIFFDTDEQETTGYTFDTIGSEYLIAGDSLYRQQAGVFNAGLVQSLSVAPQTTSRDFELNLPLTLLGAGQWLQLSAVNDETFDLMPNSGWVYRFDKLNSRGIEIDGRDVIPVPRIDGDYSEWAYIPVYLYDSEGDANATLSGPDWHQVKLAFDADHIYIHASSAHAFNVSGAPAYPYSRTLIFIDADDDPETGYPINGIGSDFVVNGDAAFKQTKDQFAMEFLGRIPLAGGENAQEVELSVPREWFRTDPSQIKLQFLNDESYDYAPELGGALNYRLRLDLAIP